MEEETKSLRRNKQYLMEEETHSLCEKRLIANRERSLWFMKEEINILWRKLPVVYGRKWSIVYGGRDS